MKKNIRRLAVLTVFVMLLTLIPLVSAAESLMMVTGNFVRVRSAAQGGDVYGTVNAGTIVTLINTGNGYMYKVKVKVNNVEREGFIYKEYLKPYKTTSNDNDNTKDNSKDNSVPKENGAVRRNNDTVRATVTKQTSVRATASVTSRVVGTLKTRTTVSVLSQKGSSVYITTSKMSGYVQATSLMMGSVKSQKASVKTVKNGDYKIYTGSTGQGKVVGSVAKRKEITVLHKGSTWSYVKVGSVYGYVANDVISVRKDG